MGWGDRYGYREYVPVAQRKAKAVKFAAKQAKKEKREPQPVQVNGTKIAKTFWGKAWCEHLESYSDYANRLPRGRTYARNGSIADLVISKGKLNAIVGGSDVYKIEVEITPLKPTAWRKIRRDCASSIDSLIDLLGGKFSDGVMQRLTRQKDGLFPSPTEIKMKCSCPDWAGLCKHLAAVLYGVGAHLDTQPELLFLLRGVDHTELVGDAVSSENLKTALGDGASDLAGEDLGAMFGIELDNGESPSATPIPVRKRKATKKKNANRKKAASTKATKKKSAKKKPSKKTAVPKKPRQKKTAKKPQRKKKAANKK